MHQWKPDPATGDESVAMTDDPAVALKSRSQKKREARAIGDVGRRLVDNGPKDLARLGLDDELRDAVLECRRLSKNARSRQLRLIAKMLRAREVDNLVARLEGDFETKRVASAAEQQNELWRARLLSEGNAALTEFVASHPVVDVGALRSLIRQALRLPTGARVLRARRELLRLVRLVRASVNRAQEPSEGQGAP